MLPVSHICTGTRYFFNLYFLMAQHTVYYSMSLTIGILFNIYGGNSVTLDGEHVVGAHSTIKLAVESLMSVTHYCERF